MSPEGRGVELHVGLEVVTALGDVYEVLRPPWLIELNLVAPEKGDAGAVKGGKGLQGHQNRLGPRLTKSLLHHQTAPSPPPRAWVWGISIPFARCLRLGDDLGADSSVASPDSSHSQLSGEGRKSFLIGEKLKTFRSALLFNWLD